MNLSLEGLKEAVTSFNIYDLKAGVRKVQNGQFWARSWFRARANGLQPS